MAVADRHHVRGVFIAMQSEWLVSRITGLVLLVLVASAIVPAPTPGHAHWLTKMLKEAGEAGGDAARLGGGALDEVVGVVTGLPKGLKGRTALAAHATPEGHWTFTNADGAKFTAASADEMGRVASALAPDAPAGGRLSLYLSDESVFLRRRHLAVLPDDADLYLVHRGQHYRLVRQGAGEAADLFARSGGLMIKLTERSDFAEAIFQLGRRLEPGTVRVLSLTPNGPASLTMRGRLTNSDKLPIADAVDPARIGEALRGVPGQTVIVTGRVADDVLEFQAVGGASRSVSLTDLRKAAAEADVNLIILRSTSGAQAGGQNWLWQTIEVEGLKEALGQKTYGGFLSGLAERRGGFVVWVEQDPSARVRLVGMPRPDGGSVIDDVGTWWGDTVSDVVGNLVTEGVEAALTSEARQKELDDRIVPGVPSDLQFYVIGAIVMGLFAFSIAHGWFSRIWPPEVREEYRGNFGYLAAKSVRWIVFIMVFLPVVGPVALLAWFALRVIQLVTWPFRALGRLVGPRRV